MIAFDNEQKFIVTGASSGLGEGVALLLNELGATVIGIARNQKRLEEMKAKCKFPENMFLEIKDLTEDIENLPNYVKELKNKYGKFAGLAYCAGVADITPLQLLDYAKMKDMFDINYFAPVFMLKGFADRRVNIGKGASCVVISSVSAHLCDKGMVGYSGSKSAISAACKTIAKELVEQGVRVNIVSPAVVDTPLTRDDGASQYISLYSEKYKLGIGEVVDVANLITFLLSDKAKWITDQDYVMDGGA